MWSQESLTVKDRGGKTKSGKAVRAGARAEWERNSVPSLEVMEERARSPGVWAASNSWQRRGNRFCRTARMKQPSQHLPLSPMRPGGTPDLRNCEIIYWCGLKPLTRVAVCYSGNRKLIKEYNGKWVNSRRKIMKGPDSSEKEVRGYTGIGCGRQALANLNSEQAQNCNACSRLNPHFSLLLPKCLFGIVLDHSTWHRMTWSVHGGMGWVKLGACSYFLEIKLHPHILVLYGNDPTSNLFPVLLQKDTCKSRCGFHFYCAPWLFK